MPGWDTMALGLPLPHSSGSRKARCSIDAELSLSSLEECRRDAAGRKGVKRLLLVGHEKVPHGFGLNGGHGGNTADGAGSLNHRLLLLFLRYGTPDWGRREKEGLCASVGILKDFSILMKTLSHHSKSV